MRGLVTILIAMLALTLGGCGDNGEKTITISGAWALYPLTVKWAEEYQKIHPDVRFDISAGGAGKGMADALSGAVDIGMVSRQVYEEEIEKGAFWVSVSKDAVVPVMNEKNPLADEVSKTGLGKEVFADIWVNGKTRSWEQAISREGVENEIHVYTRSDACGAAETWARYFGHHQEDLEGIGVFGDPGIAEAVRNDRLGIGYNNINFAYDPATKRPVEGLRIIPLDLNGNGRIDHDEDFYRTREDVVEAIADGRYPSPPSRDLHFVTLGVPKNPTVKAFVEWVLTDGQKYVPETGYVNLQAESLEEQLKKLGAK